MPGLAYVEEVVCLLLASTLSAVWNENKNIYKAYNQKPFQLPYKFVQPVVPMPDKHPC